MALCSRCTYPSIHFFVSRSKSVVWQTHIQAFTFLLTKTLSRSWSVAWQRCKSKRSQKTLKITVGCPLCTYPSIHVETLRITVGCLWSTYPSIRNKNLHKCGLWGARPPVLTPVPVPSQAIHSRAGLNWHYSDIQSTAQKSPCVNTFLRPLKKKRGNFLLQEYFRRRIYFYYRFKK